MHGLSASRQRTRALRCAILGSIALGLFGSAAAAPPPFPTPFRVIAHRGASAYAPENTIPAYARAQQLGVVDVELDVQLSKDDQVILFHDSTLLEKTGQPGSVRDHDAAALLQMDIGSWFDRTHPDLEDRFAGTKLNTLDQLFDAFGDAFYYHVELKSHDPDLARLALERIVAHGLESHVRFTSFFFEQAKRAREIAPQIPTDLLVRDATVLRREARQNPLAAMLPLQKAAIDRATETGFEQVGFASEDLSPELVRYAVDRGIQIRAWRIQSDEDMFRAIRLGTYGMTTNWPDRLIRELLRHQRAADSR